MTNHTNQSIVDSFESRRSKALCSQSLHVLLNYARCVRARREKAQLVDGFRRRTLLKRSLLSLKLEHSWKVSRHKYSRLFAVFTAWKTVTRESNLLNKYLAECNYKQKASINQSHTIEQMGGGGASSHVRASEDGDGIFSAGHQLSFADSVMVDYHPN